MNPSPLRLVNYFITEFVVKANRDFNPDSDDLSPALSLSSEVETFRQEGLYGCRLTVGISPEKMPVPYAVSLTLMGYFDVVDSYPKDKVEDLVNIGAPSILFGAAREIIAGTTARGPFSAFILPTATFAAAPKHEPTNRRGRQAKAAAADATSKARKKRANKSK